MPVTVVEPSRTIAERAASVPNAILKGFFIFLAWCALMGVVGTIVQLATGSGLVGGLVELPVGATGSTSPAGVSRGVSGATPRRLPP